MNTIAMIAACMTLQDPVIAPHFDAPTMRTTEAAPPSADRLPDPTVTAVAPTESAA